MADDPDNLVLARLREIRDMLTRVLEDTADLKLRVGMLEAGYASMSLRIDRIDNRLERLERRAGLLDADMTMSDVIDWGWVRRTLTAVQAEQRMLRGIVEPLPARMSALEARFSALEARIGGIEESINGVGLLLKYQGELLVDVARKLDA